MEIGKKIKELRIKMNLTQEELADRCELSKGFISQVERDLTSPSIATLMDILESLGTNINDFFTESVPEKIVFVKDDVFTREDDELRNRIDWIIPNAQKNIMEPILITLKPGGKSPRHMPYEGEAFGYVIYGSINLHMGNRKHRVRRGESFYYKANDPHYLINYGKNEAVVLWVSSPPSF